jgi:hypothetical protein
VYAAGLVVSIVACLAANAAGQTLLLFGVWKLNASKSNGGSPTREQGVTFEPAGSDGIFAIEDTVYADGTRTTIRYTEKVDGKDYPIVGSREIVDRADTVSLTRVNVTTLTWTYKKNGKVVLSVPGVLSPDGKTLTMTATDKRVLVYERVRQ